MATSTSNYVSDSCHQTTNSDNDKVNTHLHETTDSDNDKVYNHFIDTFTKLDATTIARILSSPNAPNAATHKLTAIQTAINNLPTHQNPAIDLIVVKSLARPNTKSKEWRKTRTDSAQEITHDAYLQKFDDDSQKVNVMRASAEYCQYNILNRRDTVLAGVCGTKVSRHVWKMFTKYKLNYILSVLWLIVLFGCMLSIFQIFSKNFVYTAPLGCIGVLLDFCFMQKRIFLRVLQGFECGYLMAVCSVFSFVLCDLFSWDERCLFVFMILISLYKVILTDATSGKLFSNIGIGAALLLMPVMAIGILSGSIEVVPRKMEMLNSIHQFTFRTDVLANELLTTLWIFFAKNLFYSLKHRDSFVLVHAPVKMTCISVGELRNERQRI